MFGDANGTWVRTRAMVNQRPEHLTLIADPEPDSVALAAIRNGAYDYLLKPFEREQLLAMVRRALEARRLTDEPAEPAG